MSNCQNCGCSIESQLLAVAEAVRDAYVHLIRNIIDERSERLADYFATLNLDALIAEVKP